VANLLSSIKTFLVSDDGPTAVEYAVMLALIVIVCISAIWSVGHEMFHKYDEVNVQGLGGTNAVEDYNPR
jgi:pilus assembly protein Flp/PilA